LSNYTFYRSLLDDPRFSKLPEAEQKRVLKGEVTLDDFNFIDLDEAEKAYASRMPPVPQMAPTAVPESDPLAGYDNIGTAGSTESGFLDWLSGATIGPAMRGFNRARQGDAAAGASLGFDPEGSAQIIAEREREIGKYPMPRDREEALQRIVGSEGPWEFLKESASNPMAIQNVIVESLGMMAADIPAQIASGFAGPLGLAAAAGTSSAKMEYGATLSEKLAEKGADLNDPYEVAKLLRDKDFMEEAKKSAVARGVSVGVFDALSAGLAGKILATARTARLSSTAPRAAGEIGLQAGAGMGGEATAQLADTGELGTFGSIAIEGIAEIPTAAIEVPSNLRYAREQARRKELIESDRRAIDEKIDRELGGLGISDPAIRESAVLANEMSAKIDAEVQASIGEGLRLRRTAEQAALPAEVVDMFSGEARAPITDEQVQERLEEAAGLRDVPRTEERQTDLERDYLFQQREREALTKETPQRESNLTDVGLDKEVESAIREGRSPTMTAALQEAGVRRQTGMLNESVLTEEQAAQRSSLTSKLEDLRSKLETEETKVPQRLEVREQALLADLDSAYNTDDALQIAKAEKALDGFYKNSKVAQDRSNTRSEIARVESEIAQFDRRVSEAYNLQNIFPDLKTNQPQQTPAPRPPIGREQPDLPLDYRGVRTEPVAATPVQQPNTATVDNTATIPTVGTDVPVTGTTVPETRQPQQTNEITEPDAPATQEEIDSLELGPVENAQKVSEVNEALAQRGIKGITITNDPNSNSAGTFDPNTATTSINAAKVQDANDAIAVAVHEIAHALNRSADQGKPISRRSLKSVLGSQNEAKVNARIEALSKDLPYVAEAVKRAKESGKYGEELLSYTLEEINRHRLNNPEKGISPRIKSLLRDVVSYIKEKLAQTGLVDISNNFTVDDLYRLGRVMEQEFSNRPESRPSPEKGAVLESAREGSNKVVGANGEPLVVYHGTKADFSDFNPAIGSTPGTWFTTDKAAAEGFGKVKLARITITNPASLTDLSAARRRVAATGKEPGTQDFNKAVMEYLESQGFDGINDPKFAGVGGKGGDVWAVFRPDQIKPVDNGVLESRARPAQPKAQEKIKKEVAGAITTKRESEPASKGESWQLKGKPTVGRAVERTRVGEAINNVSRVYRGLVSQIGNIDRSLFEALKNMRAETQLGVVEAVQGVKQLEKAITQSTYRAVVGGKLRRLPKGGVTKMRLGEIQNLLDAANNATDKGKKKKAREELANRYPAVFSAWQTSRIAIDSMTVQLMQELMAKPGGLTNKDIRLLREMKKNIGDYLTRQYSAFQAEDIRNAFLRGVMGDFREATALTEEQKKNLPEDKLVAERAKNFIRDQWLDIGDFNEVAKAAREDMDDLSIGRFQHLYDTWVDANTRSKNVLPSGATVDQREAFIEKAIQDLKQRRAELEANGVYKEELNQKAITATLDLLEVLKEGKGNPLVDYFQVAPSEGSVLKRRKDPPKPIRELLGEITDPLLQIHQTTVAMHRELARMRFLNSVYEGMEGTMWVDGAARNKENQGTFTKQLTGDKYGPLQGKWVRADIAEGLDTVQKMNDSLDSMVKAMQAGQTRYVEGRAASMILAVPRGITSYWKRAMIIYNTFNMAADFVSTAQSILADGNIPYANKQAREFAFGAAYYLINSADRSTMNDSAREAIRNMLVDSAQIGEIQEADFKRMEKLFFDVFKNREQAQNFLRDRINSKFGSVGDKIGRGMGYVNRTVSDLKAMSDVVGKLYNYSMEKQFLQKLEEARKKDNPNYKPKTERDIEKDAAATTDDTNIGYHRAPPITRTLEGLSMGTLLNFFAETARTTRNKFPVAARLIDAADAALKKGNKNEAKVLTVRATQRMAGAFFNLVANEALIKIAMKGALPMILYSMLASGDDEDKEALEKVAEATALTESFVASLNPGERSKAWVYFGKTEDGLPVFFDMSRLGVNEPTAQPVVDMLKAAVTGDPELAKRATEQGAGLHFLPPPIQKMVKIYQGNTDPTIKRTHPEAYRMLGNSPTLGHIYDVLMPRQLRQNLQMTSDESPVANMTQAQRAILSAGANLRVYDPKLDLRYATFDYGTAKSNARKELLKAVEDGVSNEKFMEIYQSNLHKTVDGAKHLLNNISTARQIGTDDDRIAEILTKGADGQRGARISKEDTEGLLYNEPNLILLESNQRSLDEQREREIKKVEGLPASVAEQDRQRMLDDIESKYDRYMDLLDKINDSLSY